MSKSHQREWVSDLLESAPSLAFLVIWRTGFDLDVAGWIGAALAAIVLVGFQLRKVRFHPILLGINLHLLVITPLIVTLMRFGMADLGGVLEAYSYKAVLVSVFLTGCWLTLVSPTGFIGAETLARTAVRSYSLLLLLACALGIAWAFTSESSPFAAVGLPLICLFALRRLLVAHGTDNRANMAVPAAIGGGTALSHDGGSGQ